MGIRDRFRRHRADDDMATITSSIEASGYGVTAEIPMAELVRRRQTSLVFRLAVLTYTAYSVGQGFHNTADLSNIQGRKCLEIVDEFCDRWDIDTINQKIAMDVWATGNAFLAPLVGKGSELAGILMLPLSSFTRIKRDYSGTPTEYIQTWGGSTKELEPDAVYHFAWLQEDASAWGTGLGQPLARKGMGYKTTSGDTVHRPSQFESSEMIDDVTVKMVYAGLPRYSLKIPKGKPAAVDTLTNLMKDLNPLQEIVTNVDHEIQTLSLDTQNKFDSFIRSIQDNTINGVMTPIPRLYSALNYTYASADAAIESTLPLIRMYQRAHKRFIENFIYKPLVIQNKKDVDKADVRINWGQKETMKIEDIKAVMDIIREPTLMERIEPDSIIDLLIDAGVPITKRAPETEKIETDMESLKSAMVSARKIADGDDLTKAEQADATREKLRALLEAKYHGK